MKIIKEKFKTDAKNRLYWGRVYFISDNREWKTKLLWAMSFEFVRHELLAETWKDSDVDHILNKAVVNRQKETGREIFRQSVKQVAYGIGPEEKGQLLDYLRGRDLADRHG